MTIADSFSRIVCINLDRRPDRWARMRSRFAEHSIGPVDRFAAVDGSRAEVPEAWIGQKGAYGCLRSHLEVVDRARHDGVDRLLILEDDVEFADDLANRFARAMAQTPDDWDLLYFGGIHGDPPRTLGDSVARVSRTLSTFAYALRPRGIDAFLEIDAGRPEAIDTQLTWLQDRYACYCIFPHAAWVEADHSDVQGREESHWYIRESIVMGNHCLDDLIGSVALVIAMQGLGGRSIASDWIRFLKSHLEPLLPGLPVVFDDGPPTSNPSELASRAANRIDPKFRTILVAGSPVFIPQRHLVAALQIARTFDVVIPFQQSVTLDDDAVSEVLQGRGLTIDPAAHPRSIRNGWNLGWGLFNRRTLESRSSTISTSTTNPTVFEVPCVALRL